MKKFIYAIFALASSMANAQTVMTLKECRETALEHNKNLAAAKLKIEKTEFDRKMYKANFFPNFGLLASDVYSSGEFSLTMKGGNLPIFNYNADLGQYVPSVFTDAQGNVVGYSQYAYFPDQEIKAKIENVFMAGITITQPLYMGGKITTAYKMSKIGCQMAQSNLRLTESEVIVSTDEAYILAVRAKQMREVAISYKDLLFELQKNVDAAVKQGMKTRNDAMKVKVKLNEAELNIVKADNGYRLAQMNLAHILGVSLTTKIEVSDQEFKEAIGKEAAKPEISSLDVSARPETDILNNKTELAKNSVKLAKSEFLPNIILAAGYSYANGIKVAGKSLMDGGNATVGVTLKVPIFHFGEGTNKIRSAKAAYKLAQLEQEELTEKMTLELAQANNNMQEAVLEVGLTQKSVEQATENLKMSKQQYEVGIEPLADYLEAHALWQKAYADAVNAQCQYLIMSSKLMKAEGRIK